MLAQLCQFYDFPLLERDKEEKEKRRQKHYSGTKLYSYQAVTVPTKPSVSCCFGFLWSKNSFGLQRIAPVLSEFPTEISFVLSEAQEGLSFFTFYLEHRFFRTKSHHIKIHTLFGVYLENLFEFINTIWNNLESKIVQNNCFYNFLMLMYFNLLKWRYIW